MPEPTLPITPPPTGTIDITNVVESVASSFETYADNFLFGLIIAQPGMAWLGLPIISSIAKFIIGKVVSALVGDALMQAFFLNTAIRKASQADDYLAAMDAKNALPTTATDKEYYDAESKEMAAFRNFVIITN